MGQFIKFTFASCLGVFLAMGCMFFVLLMIGIGAASSGKKSPIGDENVLKLDIDYAVPEHTNNTPTVIFSLNQENILGMQDILNMIADAKDDPKIAGIYLYPINTHLGSTQTIQLAEALKDFRASGKWVLSYAEYYAQGPYALAAQADTVMLNPIGSVDFRGFAYFSPFFKDLLEKTGIQMQIYYAGNFKSATEPFRRNEMSPENKLQTREYLADAYLEYLQGVSEGRSIDVTRLREIADELRSRNADDARSLGLVDQIAYEDEAHNWIRRRLGIDMDAEINFVTLDAYFSARDRDPSTSSNRIAIVYAEGEIIPGETDYGTIGDDRYTEVLADLRKNDKIKAVVLRVNSPGGSILAAENILRELALLKDAGKPIVVSMGDYAASGGYYISALADSIFAEPTTLTGSIGVFTMIPNFENLLDDKLGVHFDTVRTGTYSAAFSPFFEWSEGEHAYLQQRTDAYYELFLSHVAKYRNMTRDEVHAIAQGRIWSGIDALSVGLVDGLGGLDQAVRAAAQLADLDDYRTSEYPRVPDPFNKLLSELSGQDASVADQLIERRISKQVPYYQELKSLLNQTGPLARLPLVIQYR